MIPDKLTPVEEYSLRLWVMHCISSSTVYFVILLGTCLLATFIGGHVVLEDLRPETLQKCSSLESVKSIQGSAREMLACWVLEP